MCKRGRSGARALIKIKRWGARGGGNKRGFFAGSLIWFYLSERSLFPLLEPGRGSLPSLELMVSQPDGFIKCTDAAGPCQGQEKGSGPALPGRRTEPGAPCQGGFYQVGVARCGSISPLSLLLPRVSYCPLLSLESRSKPISCRKSSKTDPITFLCLKANELI